MPDISVHLDDPVFTYLTYESGAPSAPPLLTRVWEQGYDLAGQTTIGDTNYVPYLKIKGSWTCKVALSSQEGTLDPVTYDESASDEWRMFTMFPMLVLRRFERWASGAPEGGLLTSDPFREGTLSGSGPETGTEDTDISQASFSITSSGQYGGPDPDSYSFWLPTQAVGVDPEGDPNREFLVFDSQVRTSYAAALAEFESLIEAYQDHAGPYDPVLSFDEAEMEITVSFDTDDTAMYIPVRPCDPDVTAWGGTEIPYSAWAVSWGGVLAGQLVRLLGTTPRRNLRRFASAGCHRLLPPRRRGEQQSRYAAAARLRTG